MCQTGLQRCSTLYEEPIEICIEMFHFQAFYFLDSYHLKQELENLEVTPWICLVTYDAVDKYTSLSVEHPASHLRKTSSLALRVNTL